MRRGKDGGYKQRMVRMFPEEAVGGELRGKGGGAGFHLCLLDRQLGQVLRWSKRNGEVVH